MKRKKKHIPKLERIYALYHGDEFIDLDHAKVLIEKYDMKPDSFLFYTTPAYAKRIKGHPNRTVVVDVT